MLVGWRFRDLIREPTKPRQGYPPINIPTPPQQSRAHQPSSESLSLIRIFVHPATVNSLQRAGIPLSQSCIPSSRNLGGEREERRTRQSWLPAVTTLLQILLRILLRRLQGLSYPRDLLQLNIHQQIQVRNSPRYRSSRP
jgi:hypothetical protein